MAVSFLRLAFPKGYARPTSFGKVLILQKRYYTTRKHKGEIDIPGGIIYENDLIFISHAQLWGNEKEHYLGHVFVESKRHVAELAELTDQEAQAIGLFTSRVAKALLHTESMEHVYTFFIGDGVPHVHIQ